MGKPSPTRSAMAGCDDASGEVEDSLMSAEDLNAITNPAVFCKTAFELGLTVRFKVPDGLKYKWRARPKSHIVEDYRQQLAESKCCMRDRASTECKGLKRNGMRHMSYRRFMEEGISLNC